MKFSLIADQGREEIRGNKNKMHLEMKEALLLSMSHLSLNFLATMDDRI